jgi:hypothetical protein
MDDKTTLSGFADNSTLVAAVRAVIEKQFTLDDIQTNMTNDIIGQVVRARLDGLKKVDEAFKEIARYKTVPAPQPSSNPAR